MPGGATLPRHCGSAGIWVRTPGFVHLCASSFQSALCHHALSASPGQTVLPRTPPAPVPRFETLPTETDGKSTTLTITANTKLQGDHPAPPGARAAFKGRGGKQTTPGSSCGLRVMAPHASSANSAIPSTDPPNMRKPQPAHTTATTSCSPKTRPMSPVTSTSASPPNLAIATDKVADSAGAVASSQPDLGLFATIASLPSPADRPTNSNSRRHRSAHSIGAIFTNIRRPDIVPTQTIMKALVSRPPIASDPAIPASIQTILTHDRARNAEQELMGGASPFLTATKARRLSEAISDLRLETDDAAANRLAVLRSPCFFHRRFDDAVNIEKVLAELKGDEYSSHSRLAQTANGVREVSRQLQRRPIKRAVRNIMIVTKARDNTLVHLTRELAGWLLATPRYGSDVGVNVYVDAKLRLSKRFNSEGLTAKDDRFKTMLRYWTPDLCWSSPEKFDLVLTLGGDGTVLYTSWLFQRIVPPVLSFSLGSLGFLTNFEFHEYKDCLNEIMGDTGMRVTMRMRFTCTVYRHSGSSTAGPPKEAEQFEVLNELVIDRGPSPYVSNLELYGDQNLLTVVQADGCIFSTPTGSTAYSLSAGGSLVHPDIPAILLTPICPHTLSFRPMLFNDTIALRVAVPRHSRASAYCAFDGKGRVELRQGDYVEIAASQYPLPTVLSKPTEWFDSISRTLRWNMREATQKGWNGESYGHPPYGSDGPDDLRRSIKGMDGVEDIDSEVTSEDKFDIDFDNDEKDSTYSTAASSISPAGTGSPRKGFLAGW